MKVTSGTQAIQSIARLQPAKSSPPSQAASGFSGAKMDTVSLSSGVSARWIQEVLSTEIGKQVDSMLQTQGIDILSVAGLDWSPEATAGRIFDFTTGFFEMYKSRNPEQSDEEAVNGFEKLVRGSVQKGFEEAMNILAAHELNSKATGIAGETMSILNGMFDQYFSSLRAGLKGDEDAAAQAAEANA